MAEFIFNPYDRLSGVFPAHVVKLETRSVDDDRKVFNLTVRIAPEAKEIEGKTKPDENGETEVAVGEDMVGTEISSKGIWLNEKQSERNHPYLKTAQALQAGFTEKAPGHYSLEPFQEGDVLGKPVFVTTEFVQDRNDPTRLYFKVTRIAPWNDGEMLDLTKDLLKVQDEDDI